MQYFSYGISHHMTGNTWHRKELNNLLSLQVSSCSAAPWYIIVDSGCLHGQRAVLRKAYFEHIAVILRHGKAYGKHLYVFPWVSESVCQLIYLHVCEFMSIWDHKHLCLCTFCWNLPSRSTPLWFSLTFMRRRYIVGFTLLLGQFT